MPFNDDLAAEKPAMWANFFASFLAAGRQMDYQVMP
jgi:hypothetical protein